MEERECISLAMHKQAEARLAAKRAARAEAREIRMKELERQQKEIYQVQKKYYGLDTKFGDIEQWMEDSERFSRRTRRYTSASDEDERMSVGSRGSLRSDLECAGAYGRAGFGKEKAKLRSSKAGTHYSDLAHYSSGLSSKSHSSSLNGNRVSLYDESIYSGSRRYSASGSQASLDEDGLSSRLGLGCSPGYRESLVEERPEKDFVEKGSRSASSLSAATLASLGGTSSRRGSGDTSLSADTEASIREIKDICELKDQIQDVEGKYMHGLKEMKDSLAEVEEKYRKAMVSNAQLDNEKTNLMYQVDTLKDALVELEEHLAETRRDYEEKCKEFERQKHAYSILQFQFNEIKESLQQREEMLTEIRQLQQKQESFIREISDLQETIEWKDKKIGALERQKEFFDTIRSERDELRDEVTILRDTMKSHGIVLGMEVTTNGEIMEGLTDGEADSESRVPQETSQALPATGDRLPGGAKEVAMRNEIGEHVENKGLLQNTEKEVLKDNTEIRELHAEENAESSENMNENDQSTVVVASMEHVDQILSCTVQPSENGSSAENDGSSRSGNENHEEIVGSDIVALCCQKDIKDNQNQAASQLFEVQENPTNDNTPDNCVDRQETNAETLSDALGIGLELGEGAEGFSVGIHVEQAREIIHETPDETKDDESKSAFQAEPLETTHNESEIDDYLLQNDNITAEIKPIGQPENELSLEDNDTSALDKVEDQLEVTGVLVEGTGENVGKVGEMDIAVEEKRAQIEEQTDKKTEGSNSVINPVQEEGKTNDIVEQEHFSSSLAENEDKSFKNESTQVQQGTKETEGSTSEVCCHTSHLEPSETRQEELEGETVKGDHTLLASEEDGINMRGDKMVMEGSESPSESIRVEQHLETEGINEGETEKHVEIHIETQHEKYEEQVEGETTKFEGDKKYQEMIDQDVSREAQVEHVNVLPKASSESSEDTVTNQEGLKLEEPESIHDSRIPSEKNVEETKEVEVAGDVDLEKETPSTEVTVEGSSLDKPRDENLDSKSSDTNQNALENELGQAQESVGPNEEKHTVEEEFLKDKVSQKEELSQYTTLSKQVEEADIEMIQTSEQKELEEKASFQDSTEKENPADMQMDSAIQQGETLLDSKEMGEEEDLERPGLDKDGKKELQTTEELEQKVKLEGSVEEESQKHGPFHSNNETETIILEKGEENQDRGGKQEVGCEVLEGSSMAESEDDEGDKFDFDDETVPVLENIETPELGKPDEEEKAETLHSFEGDSKEDHAAQSYEQSEIKSLESERPDVVHADKQKITFEELVENKETESDGDMKKVDQAQKQELTSEELVENKETENIIDGDMREGELAGKQDDVCELTEGNKEERENAEGKMLETEQEKVAQPKEETEQTLKLENAAEETQEDAPVPDDKEMKENLQEGEIQEVGLTEKQKVDDESQEASEEMEEDGEKRERLDFNDNTVSVLESSEQVLAPQEGLIEEKENIVGNIKKEDPDDTATQETCEAKSQEQEKQEVVQLVKHESNSTSLENGEKMENVERQLCNLENTEKELQPCEKQERLQDEVLDSEPKEDLAKKNSGEVENADAERSVQECSQTQNKMPKECENEENLKSNEQNIKESNEQQKDNDDDDDEGESFDFDDETGQLLDCNEQQEETEIAPQTGKTEEKMELESRGHTELERKDPVQEEQSSDSQCQEAIPSTKEKEEMEQSSVEKSESKSKQEGVVIETSSNTEGKQLDSDILDKTEDNVSKMGTESKARNESQSSMESSSVDRDGASKRSNDSPEKSDYPAISRAESKEDIPKNASSQGGNKKVKGKKEKEDCRIS
nr:PREDICTED: leucine-rich repeat flightless-interacting protein 1 [Latimeria chalumnae]|eukprot:XP_014344736.1 PREDICTED: leucine-rich repeat flightless-interacting protein 1 [Latimeria chalumnae]